MRLICRHTLPLEYSRLTNLTLSLQICPSHHLSSLIASFLFPIIICLIDCPFSVPFSVPPSFGSSIICPSSSVPWFLRHLSSLGYSVLICPPSVPRHHSVRPPMVPQSSVHPRLSPLVPSSVLRHRQLSTPVVIGDHL